MADDLYTLLYVSTATRLMEESELLDLLQQSREKNARFDITGMLLYCEGTFTQALEGPSNQVLELYDRITVDTRHKGVTTLMEGSIAQRYFGNWTMGFRSISGVNLDEIDGFRSMRDAPERPAGQIELSLMQIGFLEHFRKTCLRCPG